MISLKTVCVLRGKLKHVKHTNQMSNRMDINLASSHTALLVCWLRLHSRNSLKSSYSLKSVSSSIPRVKESSKRWIHWHFPSALGSDLCFFVKSIQHHRLLSTTGFVFLKCILFLSHSTASPVLSFLHLSHDTWPPCFYSKILQSLLPFKPQVFPHTYV